MVVKVFDAYIEGEKKATGTIDEIADYFDVSRNSISLWIKNGKDPKKANPKYKHAILNKEKTKELMEQKKKELPDVREAALKLVYEQPAEWLDFYAQEYGIDYLLVSSHERGSWAVDEEYFAAELDCVYSDGDLALYSLK